MQKGQLKVGKLYMLKGDVNAYKLTERDEGGSAHRMELALVRKYEKDEAKQPKQKEFYEKPGTKTPVTKFVTSGTITEPFDRKLRNALMHERAELNAEYRKLRQKLDYQDTKGRGVEVNGCWMERWQAERKLDGLSVKIGKAVARGAEPDEEDVGRARGLHEALNGPVKENPLREDHDRLKEIERQVREIENALTRETRSGYRAVF